MDLGACLSLIGRAPASPTALQDCAALFAIWTFPLVLVTSILVIGAALRAWLIRPKVVIRFFKSTHSPQEAKWLRWYHAEVYCANGAVARYPEVGVWPPGGDHYNQWAWPGHKIPELLRKTPLLIPILLVNFTGEAGYLKANGAAIPPLNWALTPDGPSPLGEFVKITEHTRFVFKVLVTWLGEGHGQQEAEFELYFGILGHEPVFRQIAPARRRGGKHA